MMGYKLHILSVVAITTLLITLCQSCPMNCECRPWSKVVNCADLSSLRAIAARVPENTETLSLHGGTLYQLSDADFQDLPLKSIHTLEITNTPLRELNNNVFASFLNLQQLNLRNNKIGTIERLAFAGLPKLKTLDLSNNHLQSPASSDLLHPLEQIVEIDLSNNEIINFPNGFFSQLPVLHKLNIGNNSISNLRGTSFKGARNLRKFLSPHCQISTLENDFFASINSIDTLDLSYNQFRSLPNNGIFTLLHSLRNLTLTGNGISALVEEQFVGLNLDNLDLSGNKLSTINPNAFRYMPGLRRLDLSNNSLQNIPSYLFQPIAQSLYLLRISHNKLYELPDQLLSGLLKLFELDISHCGLTSLSDAHVRDLLRLKHVDISNNALEAIPQSFMDRININSMSIRLENNRWRCDCMIKPLRTWLQLSNWASRLYCKQPTNNSTTCALPRCVTPSYSAGKDITLLKDRELGECENTGAVASKETSVILGAVFGAIGGIVLLIVIVIIIMCLYRRRKRGDPLWCGGKHEYENPPQHHNNGRDKTRGILKRSGKRDMRKYHEEKKERHNNPVDPEIGSINESDKSFMIRNYFHSMNPDPDAVSEITQSMTRKDSVESLSQSGYGYGSRRGSRQSSQYSLNAGIKIESAV